MAFSHDLEGIVPPADWEGKVAEFGIGLEDGEIELLGKYLAALMDVNTRTNLTAVRDADEAWDRHIFDALTLVAVLGELGGDEDEEKTPSVCEDADTSPAGAGEGEEKKDGEGEEGREEHRRDACATEEGKRNGLEACSTEEGGGRKRVIDVGSGGGLPGIPLAIVMPEIDFVLLDATKKKTDFIENCVEWLGLKNVTVINGRAEGLGQDKGRKVLQGYVGGHREKYDCAMARAVGKIAMIAELTVPLVKVGGLVVLTKGEKAEAELAEAKKALHMLHVTHAGTVETPTGRVVVLEKRRGTPKMYPMRDGEPKRMPLGIGGK